MIDFIFLALKFFLLPLLIGRLCYLVPVFITYFRQHKKVTEDWWSIGWYFVGGEIIIFALALFLRYSGIITIDHFFTVFYQLVNGLFYLSIVVNLISFWLVNWKLKVSQILLSVMILMLSLITYSCWLVKSPQPLNWDYYQHQLLADAIRENQFSFFTNEISDTFGFLSYPPTFHLNLVLAQGSEQLTSQSIISFWQMTTYFHFVCFLLAGAALAQAFFGRKKITFLVILIGALVFDSAVSFTNLFLLPQTFTAVWLIFLLADIIRRARYQQALPWWLLPIGVIFAIFNHFVIGTIAALIFTATFVYLKLPIFRRRRVQYIAGAVIILLTIAGMSIAHLVDLSFINRGEAASYIFDFQTIFGNCYRFYGLLGIVGIIGGFLVMIYQYFTQKTKRDYLSFLFLSLMTIFVGILFSGFPYAPKFFTIFRPFFDLCLAIFLFFLMEKNRQFWWQALIVGGTTIALFVNLIANFNFWKNDLNYQSMLTHTANEDEIIADTLWSKYIDQRVLLISDPGTQHILEGLSGIDTAGGAYASTRNRLLIADIYRSRKIEDFLCELAQVADEIKQPGAKRLLALSGRSFLWFTSSAENKLLFNYNIWAPHNLTMRDRNFIQSLQKSPRIQTIYQTAYMTILEINLAALVDCPL